MATLPKSILILSGGLDSTVSAYLANKRSQPVLALTFDYGQKAAKKEKAAAARTAKRLKIPHRILNLPWMKELTSTALVSTKKKIPVFSSSDLDDFEKGRQSAADVWVPNRNGLFLNIAACFAESLGATLLVTGFNREEGLTFPDNSCGFLRASDEFFWYSTQKKIRAVSYTMDWDKIRIAREARKLKIPLNDIWSCYEGGNQPCQACESCARSRRAFGNGR